MSTTSAGRLAALSLIITLAACGGGGDGDGAAVSEGRGQAPAPAPEPSPEPAPTAGTAAACYDANLGDTPGATSEVTLRITPSDGGDIYEYVTTGIVSGPVTFEGQEAYETTLTSTDAGPPVTTTAVYKYYAKRTGTAERTEYGLTYGPDANTISFTSVESPPVVNGTYGLTAGQSIQLSYRDTPNLTVTFVGIESVTVPAGTYAACRFLLDSTTPAYANEQWVLVGTGLVVKEVQSQPGFGSVTIEALSVKVNGTAQ